MTFTPLPDRRAFGRLLLVARRRRSRIGILRRRVRGRGVARFRELVELLHLLELRGRAHDGSKLGPRVVPRLFVGEEGEEHTRERRERVLTGVSPLGRGGGAEHLSLHSRRSNPTFDFLILRRERHGLEDRAPAVHSAVRQAQLLRMPGRTPAESLITTTTMPGRIRHAWAPRAGLRSESPT